MIEAYRRRTTCRLCENVNLELILKLGPTPPGDHYIPEDRLHITQETYPVDLVYCTDCGLLQLPDVVSPEILYGNYLYCTDHSLGLAAHFQRYADEVIKKISLPKGSHVIDIGSNDGSLLQAFKKRGNSVLGVDPAPAAGRKAVESGVPTLTEFFTPELANRMRKDYGGAALVTANNVFANIDDVRGTIAGVRELLAPDGVFVFETGYMADLVAKTIIDNIYHEHLSYYSVSPLKSFFASQGMELVDIDHVPTKGGSIRGVVQRIGGPRRVKPAVAERISAERDAGLFTLVPFGSFADRAQTLRTRMAAAVHDRKAKGKSVAGFGASVGVTTLMYFFGFARELDFLADDNPIRHGLYSPGYHIPVIPGKSLSERRPDSVVLFSWMYTDPIIQKQTAYLKSGGEFIVPLPEMKTIRS
jgi:SAM-dependent methyltransferase